MIQLYYSNIGEEWPEQKRCAVNTMLPPATVAKAGNFYRWQDRQLHTGGRLLLKETIRHFKQEDNVGLEALKFTPHGKPYFEENFCFNISHSGIMVACAGVSSGTIGIDIELVAPVAMEDFRSFLTREEWAAISASAFSPDTFYDIWCRKEALAKAIGGGLTLPLAELDVLRPQTIYEDKEYYFLTVLLDDQYKSCIVTDKPDSVNIEMITV